MDPIKDLGSPEITFTFSAYTLIQSDLETLYVKSFGLYTSGFSSVSLEMIVLNINLIELSVPFAL